MSGGYDDEPAKKKGRSEAEEVQGKRVDKDQKWEMLIVGDSIVRTLERHVDVQEGVIKVISLPGNGLKQIVEMTLEWYKKVRVGG